MYAQTDLLKHIKSDDISGFMIYCNTDEELAITTLLEFSLSDTISQRELWYNKTTADSSWMIKSIQGVDKLYASLKLKAYYWVLRIYDSDTENYNMEDICVFYGSDKGMIFDYEAVNPELQTEYYKKILRGEKRSQVADFRYVKNANLGVHKLEQDLDEWFKDMKEKGLPFMREHNICPMKKRKYKIVRRKPSWRGNVFRAL